MQLTRAQKMMVEDGFPKELFRTTEQRYAYWEANPPRAMPLFEINKARDESPETAAFRALEEERRRIKSLQSIDRMKARMATKAIDFSKVRWDARRNKFVPLEGQAMYKAHANGTTALSEVATVPVKAGGIGPAPTSAEIARVVDGCCKELAGKTRSSAFNASIAGGTDWSRVNKDTAATLAKLNGVWDDKYAKLSGGLLVMTVTNRLKGLVKKGGEVKWN